MLVLVATRDTQGDWPGDYCFTVDGELVTPVTVECWQPERCGCGRGFPGLASARATTTARVVDRPDLDRRMVRQAVADALERDGWRCPEHPDDFGELVDEHVDAIMRICRAFGPRAVVRRSGPTFWADVHPSPGRTDAA